MKDLTRHREFWFYGGLAALPALAALLLLAASPPDFHPLQRAALTFVVLGVMAGIFIGRGGLK